MLGGSFCNDDADKTVDRSAYYAAAARRYALDAKMLRCRAAVHVENKDDIVFWGNVLKHFRPDDKFHFLAGSRNEYGRETFGVTQCLKYLDSLSPDFFICIDSDYRYLLHDDRIRACNFILQTYTYSFENHHCFAEGLSDVCCRATHIKNTIFDFKAFLTRYSNILYELFIWHMYFQNADAALFSQAEFDSYIFPFSSKRKPLICRHMFSVLNEWESKVKRKINFLKSEYPSADLQIVKDRYSELGVGPDNVYLFVRGHNLYDFVLLLCREVCKNLIRRERKEGESSSDLMREVYRCRYNIDNELRQNIKYGAYLPICKIEEDVNELLG